jgi:hypothetical protein
VYDTTQHRPVSLQVDDLTLHGLAILTPSTVTGQEAEKQAIALQFAEVLKKERPAIRFITLPETINALGRAGLEEDYMEMISAYRDTGIFKKDSLHKVGEAVQARYLVQLKLMNFSQGSQNRFSVLGLRLIETQYAHIRIFCQIWDSLRGEITWEGVKEMHYAVDTFKEKSVAQKTIMGKALRDIILHFP